jgi:glycerol-3-phosphate dehydrogenase
VNATGPWADALRRLEDPTAPRLLRPTKGVHVVVPRSRVGHREAIAFQSPIDGRVMFVLPWGEQSYIGTTDTDAAEPPEDVRADEADVVYLLRSVNALFPGARLAEHDVQATWAGLRPLLADGAATSTSSRSREHVVQEGRGGMLTVAGGKLTTYRAMAVDVVDRVVRRLGAPVEGGSWQARSGSDQEPVPGGDAHDFEPIRALGRDVGLPATTIEHLVAHYGTEAAGIFNLVRRDRALAEPLDPAHPAIAAEAVHAARRELAQRVEDVLVRRVHLYYEVPDRGRAAAAITAQLLGRELGWDATRVEQEQRAYEAYAGE